MRISDWSSDVCSSDLVRWIRRSRAGWRWLDGVDVPLAEEREAYRLTLAGTPGTVIDATAAEIVLPAGDRPHGATPAALAQVGTHGLSPGAPVILPAFEEERSEETTFELQSLVRISYGVLCVKK